MSYLKRVLSACFAEWVIVTRLSPVKERRSPTPVTFREVAKGPYLVTKNPSGGKLHHFLHKSVQPITTHPSPALPSNNNYFSFAKTTIFVKYIPAITRLLSTCQNQYEERKKWKDLPAFLDSMSVGENCFRCPCTGLPWPMKEREKRRERDSCSQHEILKRTHCQLSDSCCKMENKMAFFCDMWLFSSDAHLKQMRVDIIEWKRAQCTAEKTNACSLWFSDHICIKSLMRKGSPWFSTYFLVDFRKVFRLGKGISGQWLLDGKSRTCNKN